MTKQNREKKFNALFVALFAVFAVALYFAIFTTNWGDTQDRGIPGAIKIQGKVQAPDFSLPDLSGALAKLSDFRGKVVLLHFWAPWCVPCRVEIPELVEIQRRYRNADFQLLAVSIDEGGRDAVNTFYQGIGVSLPTLIDRDGKVSRQYGLTGVPESMLLDKKGLVAKTYIGPRKWTSPEITSQIDRLLQEPVD